MKSYLGDSVYIESDGFGFTLTTENGFGPSNTIYMEDQVVSAFMDFIERDGFKDPTKSQGKEKIEAPDL